jgi:carbon-monoxide dehydrogenase large subunit
LTRFDRSWSQRTSTPRTQRKLRGIGIVTYIEAAGWHPLGSRANWRARWPVRKRQCPRQSLGDITVFTGSHNHGQGHETVFAQIVGDMLAVPRMWSEVIAATR